MLEALEVSQPKSKVNFEITKMSVKGGNMDSHTKPSLEMSKTNGSDFGKNPTPSNAKKGNKQSLSVQANRELSLMKVKRDLPPDLRIQPKFIEEEDIEDGLDNIKSG